MAIEGGTRRGKGALIGLVDQGVSSATNLLAVLAVAASLNADGFGVFSVVYGGLTLALGLGRSYLGLPIALEGADATDARSYNGGVTLIALAGLPIILLLGLLGWAVAAGHGLGWIGLIVAIATPLVVVQDLGRFQAMAQGKQWLALASDTLWLLGAATLWAFRGVLPTVGVLWVWLAAIVAAALIVTLPLRPRWAWHRALELLKPARGARESASIAVLLSAGGSMFVGLIVAGTFGPAGAGALRGAGTLMGVMNTLIAFLDFGVLIRLARRHRSEDRKSLAVMLVVYLIALGLWTAILLWIPGSAGEVVLGDTWISTRAILPITALEYVSLVAIAVLGIYCKLRDQAKPILVGKVTSTCILLVGVLVLAAVGAQFIWVPVCMAVAAAVGLIVMFALISARSRGSRP